MTVRAAALPDEGHVVLRADTDDGPGEFVGSSTVPAGTSRNVTVEVDEDHFRGQEGSFVLYATIYRDDGDGAFDENDDDPFTAGSDTVSTRFGVEKTGGPTPTPTTDDDGHDEGDGHDHEHSPTGTAIDGANETDDTGSSVGAGAGFGLLTSLAAAALFAVGLRRRR